MAPDLVGTVRCVVDLSAAYRLKDASLYPGWYGFAHDQPVEAPVQRPFPGRSGGPLDLADHEVLSGVSSGAKNGVET